MERKFDLIVVGSGSAGASVAHTARKRGWTVAVVDKQPFGGTCALRGCDPKKVLVAAGRVAESGQRWAELGVFDRAPVLQWEGLMRFKRTFTDPVPKQREDGFKEAGIVALHGRAQFQDERTIRIDGDAFEATRFVIASGAVEQHVAQGDDQLLTSETFLDLQALPNSLLFIGGGYIAFEFAHVAARAGSKVTILHSDDHPLHGFDSDAVDKVLSLTREIGIDVVLNTTATSVTREATGVLVVGSQDGQPQPYRAENGVLAAGRVPDLEDLGMNAAGIEWTKHGVRVNEFLQSVSNPTVYACGDAADAGGLPLTPVAAYEGEIVAANLLDGNSRTPTFDGLASIVYTIPALAMVGVTEAQARDKGMDIDVRSGDMKQWYSTRHVAGRAGFYKAVIEKQSGRILGVTILGPHAEEQINVLALAIRQGLTSTVIADALFAYPTGSSDLEFMVG